MFSGITYFYDNQSIPHLRVGKFSDPQTVKSLIVNALGDALVCPPCDTPGRTFLTKSGRFRRKALEKLLLADSGDEFLQIERFEVCNVLEVPLSEGLQGRGKHG